jgi:hypothetical protein
MPLLSILAALRMAHRVPNYGKGNDWLGDRLLPYTFAQRVFRRGNRLLNLVIHRRFANVDRRGAMRCLHHQRNNSKT